MWNKVLKWIGYNRFTVILPLVIAVGWLFAFGCTPEVKSPMSGVLVNADELSIEFEATLARFDLAAKDLERQYEQQEFITQLLTQLATGGITNWGGVINLITAGGGVGLFLDNRRKNTVINSMKRGSKIT